MHSHIVKDNVQYNGHERDMKKHATKHRLLLEQIHEFKSLESSDSEQHNEWKRRLTIKKPINHRWRDKESKGEGQLDQQLP